MDVGLSGSGSAGGAGGEVQRRGTRPGGGRLCTCLGQLSSLWILGAQCSGKHYLRLGSSNSGVAVFSAVINLWVTFPSVPTALPIPMYENSVLDTVCLKDIEWLCAVIPVASAVFNTKHLMCQKKSDSDERGLTN